jgi:hypothetical protein
MLKPINIFIQDISSKSENQKKMKKEKNEKKKRNRTRKGHKFMNVYLIQSSRKTCTSYLYMKIKKKKSLPKPSS